MQCSSVAGRRAASANNVGVAGRVDDGDVVDGDCRGRARADNVL